MKKITLSIVILLAFISIGYAARNNVALKATGSGAMNETIQRDTLGDGLIEVYLHLNTPATTSEYFSIQIDSADGSEYDTVLFKKDLSDSDDDGNPIEDVIYSPENIKTIESYGDYIDFTYTNTDGITWGLTVISK